MATAYALQATQGNGALLIPAAAAVLHREVLLLQEARLHREVLLQEVLHHQAALHPAVLHRAAPAIS